jgi:hypothetical protein
MYVDTYGPSSGHDACAPDGVAWIQGQALDLLRAAPYHPRYEGMAGVADIAHATVLGARPVVTAAEQAAWSGEARALRAKAATQSRPPAELLAAFRGSRR